MHGTFRSGFVALCGRPNVGKSTLLNALVGERVSLVSPKPQTTRTRVLGIKNLPQAQIIFLDTPGLRETRRPKDEQMAAAVRRAVHEGDIVLLVTEPQRPDDRDRAVLRILPRTNRALLVINKIDLVAKRSLLPVIEIYSRCFPFEEIIPISALRGDGLEHVTKALLERLPPGPRYFPDEGITDQPEKVIVAELVRGQAMRATRQEVPYAITVTVDEFKERGPNHPLYIRATLAVKKESQKGILIGKSARTLKRIGQNARREIEDFLQTRVFLDLWVKVRPIRREDGLLPASP